MIKKLFCSVILILSVLTSALCPWAAAEESLESEKEYTDITYTLSREQRQSLSDYLCRFGACYTTDFESDNGGKIVFNTNNWTNKMSEIIWWQYLAYSKRDRQNPNAPISGNTKTVTPDNLQNCIKNTFGINSTPDAVRSSADNYYIDHTDGNYHPPQQDPSGTMWTWSPESCKIQYFVKLKDGGYLIHYIPEYLESGSGKHNGSLYYAKLREGETSCGYIADELGTLSSLDDKYIKAGFIEEAKNGSEAVSNISIDYKRTEKFSSVEEYDNYLEEILAALGDHSPSGPGLNDIAAYISAACIRNSKIEITAENNTVTLTPESLEDSAVAAEKTSNTLWERVTEKGITPNKKVIVPIQVIMRDLNEDSAPKITFDRSLADDDMSISYIRILIGDNNHSVIMDKATLNKLIKEYGAFSIEMGAAVGNGYIINFFNENNERIDKLPIKVNFSIPAQDKFDSVYTTSDGRDFNIGGIFDENNKAIEFKTNSSGLYKVKNNEPNLSDINDIGEREQEHIKLLVSKDYFAAKGTRFEPNEQYSNYDAARAVAGMLFTVDTDARAMYNDVDEADPQSMYVASVEEANIKLFSAQGGLRFNGNSAVGLEDTFALSMALLVDYKEYYVPNMGNDSDRPYASIYLNYPDINYMNKSSLGNLALGAREGIINDGMALTAQENRLDRKTAAEFLYRLFVRMCEVSPAEFDAGENGYRSVQTFYNPISTMKFETPPVVYIYLGCLAVGVIFAILLWLMQKKHKIVNENAEDAGGDDDYWNEY